MGQKAAGCEYLSLSLDSESKRGCGGAAPRASQKTAHHNEPVPRFHSCTVHGEKGRTGRRPWPHPRPAAHPARRDPPAGPRAQPATAERAHQPQGGAGASPAGRPAGLWLPLGLGELDAEPGREGSRWGAKRGTVRQKVERVPSRCGEKGLDSTLREPAAADGGSGRGGGKGRGGGGRASFR